MPRMIALTARDVLDTPLPSLLVGPFHTTSGALHQVRFTGRLRPWQNFERNVIALVSSNIRWSRRTIDVAMVGQGAENSVSREQLVVGDENGVQGRLNERLCRAVTSCLQAQGHNLRSGDFKAGNSPAQIATAAATPRVPDVVVLNANAAIKVVGEVKTPWPRDHVKMLSRGVQQFELGYDSKLRRILGMYNMVYTILTIYQCTNISYRTSLPLYAGPKR